MPRITLAAARVSKGWTQAEMAEKMGVSRQTVFDWENGKRPMKLSYIYMFCGLTGFAEHELILPKKSN